MKFVKQSYEILEQEIPVRKLDDYTGSHFKEQYMNNMYEHIERCGRTCYKSEDRITPGSAKRFVEGLIKTKHYSVLEHGVIYLKIPKEDKYYLRYSHNNYSKYYILVENNISEYLIITTNYRVIIENGWEDDLQYLCTPTEYHELRHTSLLHTCIHVYKDLTRHRPMSFSIESTRYCNYILDKFGSMLKYVKPTWYEKSNLFQKFLFTLVLKIIEIIYLLLIKSGWKAEEAAEILPQCTASDVIMSGFDSDWEHVFDLRVLDKTGKAHPLVHDVMDPLYEEFKKRK